MDEQRLRKLAAKASKHPLGIAWLDEMLERDQTRTYYRFLYLLSKALGPSLVVELGSQSLRSTAHLAAGCPESLVIGIDPEPWEDPKIMTNCPNIRIIKSRSQDVDLTKMEDRIDLLFIDSEHSYDQVMFEMTNFGALVKTGGVILVDDINYPEWPGVRKAWEEINAKKKIELNDLHMSGFGAIIVWNQSW